ncbi:MAG: sulfatase-like hydrolase/transferase [Verrucomicrobia bacterium]|nr:sulfatase-like hydrolase/transferase [Verrucomicrobiota bacterium]
MSPKIFLPTSLSFLALLIGTIDLLAQTNSSRPNIILMMADDLGWGDTGYNGHPYLNTPNLDRMSAEGVTFTRFYSAAAMCSPTRGSCYTGRNPYRFGITYAMKGRLEATEIPISTVVKKAGYTTGHFGKWHLGTLSREKGDQSRWGFFEEDPVRYYCPPWERDVDVCFVTESKVPTWDPLIHPGPITDKEKADIKVIEAKGTEYGNDYFVGEGQQETENTNGDDSRVIMDRALPFIQNAVRKDTPFFAVIWFHTPHSPVVGGVKYRAMYKNHPEDTQHYYACVTAMDEQVGRLRAELTKLGVADNTMLWFCSDNGPARQGSPRHVGSPGHLSGFKLSIQEGGIRVPGLMVWPDKVKKPLTVSDPCVTSDYFPTILSSLGIPLPDDRVYDGVSLWPFIEGTASERTKPIGFLNKDAKESVWMRARYKLISTPQGDQLYDIIKDSAEKKDLTEDLPAITQTMKTELTRWKDSVLAELKAIQ